MMMACVRKCYSFFLIPTIFVYKLNDSPIIGPIATMNKPLATIWSPKAAGSFSRLQCSEIVSVKLMSVAPLKNPFISRVIRSALYVVCSASATEEKHAYQQVV